jgi:hypothetical protein
MMHRSLAFFASNLVLSSVFLTIFFFCAHRIYQRLGFTENPDKYFLYPPGDVERAIREELFEGRAPGQQIEVREGK